MDPVLRILLILGNFKFCSFNYAKFSALNKSEYGKFEE